MKNRKNKGITLVALVITIIILLILAGVTINLILGENGLLKRAEESKEAHLEGEKNDIEFMNSAYGYMNKYLIEENEGLIGKIAKIKNTGHYNVSVNGRNTEGEEMVDYNVHTIVYNGNLVLDGITNVEGATIEEQSIEKEGTIISQKVYEFGDKNIDVAKKSVEGENEIILDATNMVVLKVNGDLTINENVVLTACKSDEGYGGPKGMLVYCTGTLTNNGTISMTARGARAEGQNVYLWKNEEYESIDKMFEYVTKDGANGGAQSVDSADRANIGNNGENGIGRQTGGGASGCARAGDGYPTVYSGAGSKGTSYSGGSGGGACHVNNYGGKFYAEAAEGNGRKRRKWLWTKSTVVGWQDMHQEEQEIQGEKAC